MDKKYIVDVDQWGNFIIRNYNRPNTTCMDWDTAVEYLKGCCEMEKEGDFKLLRKWLYLGPDRILNTKSGLSL